jgi:FMN reductase [NAD(P)H]
MGLGGNGRDGAKLGDLLNQRFGAGAPVPQDEAVEPELARILARRTHRRYTDAPVPPALIDRLLYAALSASSKSDFQQASILKLEDAGKRAALGAEFPAMPWIGAAPVFLVFLADPRRLETIGAMRGHPQPQRDVEAFLNASADAALAMQTFILAAESVGLGCCPISVIRNKLPLVADLLKLPDGVYPLAGLCVGWPADEGHASIRLAPSVTIHTDTYDAGVVEPGVEAYDRARHERHAMTQQRNPARFGQAAFYGWSEDKARQAAEPEGEAFADYIRRTWFRF